MPPGNPDPVLNTCPSCQEIIDVSSVRPYEKIHCPLCGDTIRVRTVFNNFTLKGEIGQGGMSRVFRAVDNNLGREVALKILHTRCEDQPQLAGLFEREAKLTACVTHPHVVQVYSAGQAQGYFYIAMELLPKKSLEQLIKEDGRIPEPEALRIIHEVALGLSAAFQHGLIHRDVKPGNILLDHDGSAKLVDFGLALMQGAEEDQLADIWATPFYVPPEKLWNRPEDFRSDIYSLGATLYHMIAGRPSHCAETDSVQELITIKSQPLDLRVGAPHMHEPTLQLISRMMAYDPPARYTSYEELLAAIEAVRRRVDPRVHGRRGLPSWAIAGLALVGTAVLAAVGLLAAGHLKPGASGTAPTSPAKPASSLIVNPEETALSQLLPRGRDALIHNNPQQALSLFKQLAASDRARADLRTWAAFHAGLETLVQGDLESSKVFFTEASLLSLALDQEFTQFFGELAQVLKIGGAPPPPKSGSSELESLRSLPLGVRSWLAGDFRNTALHLSRFLAGQFSGSYAWATVYQTRVAEMHADAKLVASLPDYTGPGEIQSLTEHLDRLAAIHKQLRDERCRKLVATSIETAEKRIAELAEAARTAASNQAMSADFTLVRQTREAVLEKAAGRQFADMASTWRTAGWKTDSGKRWAALQADACDQAARFVALFAAALSPDMRYEGEILRTEGRSFTAKLVRLTPETMTVDLGFGPTPLKLETISNPGLLKIAQATVLQKGDPQLAEAACFFAWFAGLEEEARGMAETLRASAPFQERWDAVTRPIPNS